MPTPILTACRQAVWTAIEAHSPLQGVFRRKYKFEDKPGGIGKVNNEPNPTIQECPAIAIYPAQPTSQWTLNSAMRIDYPLEITFWTPDWDVTKAEFIWQEIIKALYQHMESLTGTSNRIVQFSSLASQAVQLGDNGPVATRWSMTVLILAAFWNPKQDT